MIISASRRTDIPAFYSEWFINRINEGYVLVRNPMNYHQVSRISLKKEVVDCFVFWTKNPANMLNKLHLLEGYNYYFQFTLNPYGRDIELNVPQKVGIINNFIYLSNLIGKNRVIWRYDPILLTENINIDYHCKHFDNYAKILSKYTSKCVISFLDLYRNTANNLKKIPLIDITEEDMRTIANKFKEIANKYSLPLYTCAEHVDLSDMGILKGKCIDDALISEIAGSDIIIDKDPTQRDVCGCVASIDIGAYNTCKHNCLYCYANFSKKTVATRTQSHNVNSRLIFGELFPDDKVTERKVKSCLKYQAFQPSLF